MAPLQRSTAPAPPQANQLQIQHFIHQHPLQKLFMAFEFNCNGCHARGYGVRFRCSACDFDLHEQCATSPHHLSSHVHPHHQLLLVNRPGNSHFCDVCKGFTDGLSYTCQTCEFDVHTLCTQIPVATGVPQLTSNQSQQQGGVPCAQPTTAFGGFQGVNHSQHVMANHHQQQPGIPTTVFGGYNDSKPVMINHQQQQQQQPQLGMPTAAFGGYQGVNNNQAVMINYQQQQQQQGMPTAAYGGYNVVNNNQPMMMNQQQQQQQQQGKSNNYAKAGKFAASVLMTSLIGVPINFNSKR